MNNMPDRVLTEKTGINLFTSQKFSTTYDLNRLDDGWYWYGYMSTNRPDFLGIVFTTTLDGAKYTDYTYIGGSQNNKKSPTRYQIAFEIGTSKIATRFKWVNGNEGYPWEEAWDSWKYNS